MHLAGLRNEMEIRFKDLIELKPPQWLSDIDSFDPTSASDLDSYIAVELLELKENNAFVNKVKCGKLEAWLTTAESSPHSFQVAVPFLISFPSTWLVETGFSAVCDIFTQKRSKLDIENRGLLRLKLNQSLTLDLDALVERHQDQGSH